MCEPTTLAIIAVGIQVAMGAYGAYSQYQQGLAQKSYYDYLAAQKKQEGELALKTGQKQSELIQDVAKEQGKELKKSQAQFSSTQRAAMAAAGVDLSSVSAQDIVSSTFDEQKLDELALRYNADIKSWGVTTEASYKNWASKVLADQYDYAGRSAKQAGKIGAFNTLLGTATSVLSSFALSGLGGGSTQGLTGWLKGYGKGTPKNTFDTGSMTLFT